MIDVCYFGCWNRPGHYLFGPHGSSPPREAWRLEHYNGQRRHLDGTLAPRQHRRTGKIVWSGMDEDRRLEYDSDELPQGQFLRHDLDTGFTAIQWWDRTQGDRRGACNGTVLMRGHRTSEEMLAALAEHFPTVLKNLTAAGVTLLEVFPNGGER